MFTQDKDKVSETKVETPYEKRQREIAESRGESFQGEEKKEKSSDEIAEETANMEKRFRVKYQQVLETELALLTSAVNRLYATPKLNQLADKVLFIASQINDIQPSVTVNNLETQAIFFN
jgi:hypothetical protein